MDERTWNGVLEAITSTHRVMMERGRVTVPCMFPFVRGQLVGHVALREVQRGRDAARGVAEMAQLAAAAGADAIVVAWERFGLALACDQPLAWPEPELEILWAAPDGEAVLYRFPYHERRLWSRTEEGLRRAEPRWLPLHAPVSNPELPVAIATLVHFSWEPFHIDDANLVEQAAVYLRAQGYAVELIEPQRITAGR